jgi:amidohydrolase
MEKFEPEMIRSLVSFRKELHRNPELSHHEVETAGRVAEWLARVKPDKIITSLGGHGVAAVYDSGRSGPSVLFRCELDALPISERSGLPYQSARDGVAHLCGHDGHMAILLGLSTMIHKHRPDIGRAILLFQPAEETGMGAANVIADPSFTQIRPDYAFAIHNLPGFERNHIVLADPVFSAGSVGMEIELTGKTSHAAEPENGINPALAVSNIIRSFNEVSSQPEIFDDFVLITIVQIILGEKAFGTSAGHALLRATLRALNERDFNSLISSAKYLAERTAKSERLKISIKTLEEFPVTANHPECTLLVKALISQNGWPAEHLEKPFRWSEDFGHFTKNCKGALVGIGSGLDHPKLHHPDYDFPDEILPMGIELLSSIYQKLLIH